MKHLMVRGATLEVPPSRSGLEQMSKNKVIVTKKIAYAQIHVERAIGRIRVFSILKKTLPITLVPLVDEILVYCASISNLLPPPPIRGDFFSSSNINNFNYPNLM